MILDKIEADIKVAMKEKTAEGRAKLELLRSLKTALTNKKTETGKALTKEQEIQVLQTAQKQRTQAAEGFGKGGNLAGQLKEENEYELISLYLPKKLEGEQLNQLVASTIVILGNELKDKEKLKIGDVLKEVKSSAAKQDLIVDGKLLSEVVKAALEQ